MRGPWLVLAACAACSFTHGTATGTGLDDGGNETVTWPADFTKGTRVDLGVEPWGPLTSAGYFHGSLYSRGADGAILWHPTDPSFSVDAAATTMTTGANLWAATAVTSTQDMTTLGITGSTFSAWSVGDVYLQAGTYQFQLTANDVGFVEIAQPHTTAYATVISSINSVAAMQSFVVAADDWYPMRTALTSTTATWLYDLQLMGPADNAMRRFNRAEMRGRVEEGRGLMQALFSHQLLTATRSSHQLASDAIAGLVWPLYGQDGPGNSFSVRWFGQFYAKDAGSYVLQATANGGTRVAAAGQGSSSNYVADNTSASVAMATLVSTGPGWYDVAFDLNMPGTVTMPSFAVSVASGPELAGMPLPVDRLRGVEWAGDRLVNSSLSPQVPIPDQGSATATLPALTALPGETVTSLVARAYVDNPEYGPGRLKFTLANPSGDRFTLDPSSYSTGGTATATYYWQIDPTTTGATALFTDATVDGGSWTLTATDLNSTSSNAGGTLHEANISLHTTGGPKPLAPDGRWTSEVVDTTSTLVDVESVTWVERAAQPATVQLRACDAPCVSEAWIDAQNGAPIDLGTGHRYLQARVEVFSDGVLAPEFEQLTVMYKRKPQ